MSRKQRVFLSYAREDLDTVKTLYDDLKKREVNVWLDKVDLGPGDIWKKEALKAIAQSTDFIICLSQAALRKTGDEPGFMDEELDYAHSIAQQQSVQEFRIIVVRLEDCDRGDHRLSTRHQIDLFEDWDGELDRLAIQFGGYSLADKQAIDERTEDEKMIERLHGKAVAFFYAEVYDKAHRMWDVVADLERNATGAVSVRTLVNKGVALEYLGRHDEALEAHSKALGIDPNFTLAWYNKGVALEKLKRHDEALEAHSKGLAIDPNLALAWCNKGVALSNLGRHDEALEALDKALAIDPNVFKAWIGKGAVLENLGRHDEALDALDKALAINPNFALAWYDKGVVLGNLERHDEALDAFDKALAIDPNLALAWCNKGVALEKLKRYDEVLAVYEKALAIDSDNALFLNNKGWILQQFERYNEALAAFDKALAIDPDNALARNNKRYVLEKLGRME